MASTKLMNHICTSAKREQHVRFVGLRRLELSCHAYDCALLRKKSGVCSNVNGMTHCIVHVTM